MVASKNSALANVMMRRGLLDASSAVEHLEIGIYEVQRDLPDWISFGWAIIFLPTKGSLNGAYAVSYASGTDAGMYYYSNRTSGWVHIA